jgi:ketosteroid isomerase-like protein
MLPADLIEFIEEDHKATEALLRGDPEPKKKMFSRREDVTLANPIGPPVREWEEIARTLERVASQMREGDPIRFERVAEYGSGDLAYIVEFERNLARVGSLPGMVPLELRVTTIYRREEGGWRIAHRHADTVTTPRSLESVFSQPTSG